MNSCFLDNKFTRWYFQIIKNPDTSGYTEKHHIIPRCMGGDNSQQNIVALSARQHFTCHLLLTKMTNDPKFRGKLNYALRYMLVQRTSDGKRYIPKSSRIFEKVRRAHKGIPKSIETRKKISESKRGKLLGPMPVETRKKIGNANKGKSIPEYQREKISSSLKGKDTWMKGKKHSAESIKKMSQSQKGHTRGRGKKHTHDAVIANKLAQLKRLYTISSPAGELFEIRDLKTFCAKHGLPYQTLADRNRAGVPIKDHHNLKMKDAIGWCVIKIDDCP